MNLSYGLVISVLSVFIVETVAETCYGNTIHFTCIFGCCSDGFTVYCCFNNGGGLSLIALGAISIIGAIALCCRYQRTRANRQCATRTGVGCNPQVMTVSASPYSQPTVTFTAKPNMGAPQVSGY